MEADDGDSRTATKRTALPAGPSSRRNFFRGGGGAPVARPLSFRRRLLLLRASVHGGPTFARPARWSLRCRLWRLGPQGCSLLNLLLRQLCVTWQRPIARTRLGHGLRKGASFSEASEGGSPQGLLRLRVISATRVGQHLDTLWPIQHVARSPGTSPMHRVQLRANAPSALGVGMRDADLPQWRKTNSSSSPNPKRLLPLLA
mmetsp:Transcript_2580/g.9949  ORF Transcript_2580/g.9949 Transcript_2580/m.9949 type:complete len:202 (-) Transcript_2580:1211-1816(-)